MTEKVIKLINNEKSNEVGKGTEDSTLTSPCTVLEVLQLARAVTEDAMMDNQRRTYPLLTSLSLNIELLKEILISSGAITEDYYIKLYNEKVEAMRKLQAEVGEKMKENKKVDDSSTPRMDLHVNDIEVKKGN